jgi:transposase
MRSTLMGTFGLLMMAACSSAPAPPVPSFGSPESAAAYLVLQPRERGETRTVILNIPPGVDMAAAF